MRYSYITMDALVFPSITFVRGPYFSTHMQHIMGEHDCSAISTNQVYCSSSIPFTFRLWTWFHCDAWQFATAWRWWYVPPWMLWINQQTGWHMISATETSRRSKLCKAIDVINESELLWIAGLITIMYLGSQFDGNHDTSWSSFIKETIRY